MFAWVAVALAYVATASLAYAADKVVIGYIGGMADVGFYVADAKGFLRDEGIEANFILFNSSSKMVAPLATGELDVGSGAVSAATYNALARGIPLRAAADKSRSKGVYSYTALVVRKALWDSGEIRTLKDLKGHRMAFTGGEGTNEHAVLAEAMQSVGLSYDDVEKIAISMPQQVAAYANGAVDASFLAEPFLSAVINAGVAVKMMPVSQLRENSVTGIELYSDHLITQRPDVALRLTKAYIRGLRVYVGALKDARLAGPGAEEVVDIISRYSTVKDKSLLLRTTPHYVDPDGRIYVDSLRKDWEFYRKEGLIKGDATVDQLVDTRWVDAAVKELGPYVPRNP
jgi:NitT/TauT family transport system substrate-binding protein